eukprot:scaffold111038_cov43-Attheya_sp.AAC.1
MRVSRGRTNCVEPFLLIFILGCMIRASSCTSFWGRSPIVIGIRSGVKHQRELFRSSRCATKNSPDDVDLYEGCSYEVICPDDFETNTQQPPAFDKGMVVANDLSGTPRLSVHLEEEQQTPSLLCYGSASGSTRSFRSSGANDKINRYPNKRQRPLEHSVQLCPSRRTSQSAMTATTRSHAISDNVLEYENDTNSLLRSASFQRTSITRGGAATVRHGRPLVVWENMVCGAVSRSLAETIMHPANTMKTILQSNRSIETQTLGMLAKPENLKFLSRGAGTQFFFSVPHGAIHFAVLEYVRRRMNVLVSSGRLGKRAKEGAFGPGLDFMSSAISTISCSIISTPQMMITDNIMAGTYPNLPKAIKGLASSGGIRGFYSGWWPDLAGKIPSYQLKLAHGRITKREPRDLENSILGCMASGTCVCIMIPMDTIKTRLVTQARYPDLLPYKGIFDCAVRVAKEEGMGTFYRGLAPRNAGSAGYYLYDSSDEGTKGLEMKALSRGSKCKTFMGKRTKKCGH